MAFSFPSLLIYRRWLLIVSALLALLMTTSLVAAQPVLRVLAWPGYAAPEVVQAFEQQHGVKVELTVVTSDASLWEKVSAHNRDFDVFAVNTAELQRYLAANLVQALHPAQIPNTRQQLARFQHLRAVRDPEQASVIYAIPYTYSAMGLIYDRKQIATPPRSINVLWDKRYQGKVLAYDGGIHNFSLAAQSLGFTYPFHLAPKNFPRAANHLIELRRNVLAFYAEPEAATQLFIQHGAALMFANYGMQQVQMLKQAGADIGYVIPQEGALAWLDCWSITRAARDPALAHAWIDHLLGPQASRLLVEREGLSNTLREQQSGAPQAKIIWLQAPEDSALREKLWARIRAGDRLSRVMRP